MNKPNDLYVVTQRCGSEMGTPVLFRKKEQAEAFASKCLRAAVLDRYDGESKSPRMSTLEKWAEKKGYTLYEWYFWDGCYESFEIQVDRCELP